VTIEEGNMVKRKKFNFGLYLAVAAAGLYFFRRMKAGKTAVPTTLSNQVASIYTGGH
jgi:hypothetical protein